MIAVLTNKNIKIRTHIPSPLALCATDLLILSRFKHFLWSNHRLLRSPCLSERLWPSFLRLTWPFRRLFWFLPASAINASCTSVAKSFIITQMSELRSSHNVLMSKSNHPSAIPSSANHTHHSAPPNYLLAPPCCFCLQLHDDALLVT